MGSQTSFLLEIEILCLPGPLHRYLFRNFCIPRFTLSSEAKPMLTSV